MTIVVLGGGITKEGILPAQVKERLKLAIQTYRSNFGAKILLCGKYSFLYPKKYLPKKTEAQAMKEYLIKFSIPSKIIFLEERSKDTISNAYYAKIFYFLPKKEKKAIIITSEFHLPRTKFIYGKIFGRSYKFKYIATPSNLKGKKRKNILTRQKNILDKTKKILEKMREGNHNFLKGKFYKIKYYREKRPNWVIKFVTQGK